MKTYCLLLLSLGVIGCSPAKKFNQMPTSGHSSTKEIIFEVTSEDPIFPELLESCKKLSRHATNTTQKTPLGGNYDLYSHPMPGVFSLLIKGIYPRQCFIRFDKSTRTYVTFTVTTTLETFKEITAQKIAQHIIEASDFLPEKTPL